MQNLQRVAQLWFLFPLFCLSHFQFTTTIPAGKGPYHLEDAARQRWGECGGPHSRGEKREIHNSSDTWTPTLGSGSRAGKWQSHSRKKRTTMRSDWIDERYVFPFFFSRAGLSNFSLSLPAVHTHDRRAQGTTDVYLLPYPLHSLLFTQGLCGVQEKDYIWKGDYWHFHWRAGLHVPILGPQGRV